jgi:hypothetical protein
MPSRPEITPARSLVIAAGGGGRRLLANGGLAQGRFAEAGLIMQLTQQLFQSLGVERVVAVARATWLVTIIPS